MTSNAITVSGSQSSLSRNWIYNVFASFHGADVRKNFLSHLLKEFKRKGIVPFIDNEIKRGEFIGPELKTAIHGSRIAIVLLSKNYASSSWCLDELVEIMKCKEYSGQTVMAVFYEVDPSDVKKQTGDFGKVFGNTCAGKTDEATGRWRKALSEVATIAGYHSINSENDAKLIEDIATEVSNKLFQSSPSRDFDDLIGMGSHMEKMKPLLCQDLDKEVRMIGIWGPPGIGKTTIARYLFAQDSHRYDLSVFMSNIRTTYTKPVCSDDYDTKLLLQQDFMSQIIDEKEIKVPHLGIVQERLNDKRVLVVLDDVDLQVQLEALAKDSRWFGQGSRIIITTQHLNLLKAHGIKHIYRVNLPPSREAIQIFCMHAFNQQDAKDGFEDLIWEVILLSGKLPLALKVMGSYFRGMSREEWKKALPKLRNSLDGQIESVLKFSYNALSEEDKNLFLHITCFFKHGSIDSLEDYLPKTFSNFRQGVDVLVEKSFISVVTGYVEISSLLVQLGREIVQKKYASEHGKFSIRKPGKRQYLVSAREICDVLSDDTAGSSNVIGIDLSLSEVQGEWDIGERAFETMSNLQYLNVNGDCDGVYFPTSLNSISRKLIILSWYAFPMTCLPANFNPRFLVLLSMEGSKLVKLWDGIKPLTNLKKMSLRFSKNLKELPDLSTATNLEILHLSECSSLVKLPSSIGNAINLKFLYLSQCTSLAKLPSSIGDLTNIQELSLDNCSSLVALPSSLGNATNLIRLSLRGCSNLVELPFSIGNATKLEKLDLSKCSSLVELPISIGNLNLQGLSMIECSKLEVLPININMKFLAVLDLSDCSRLKHFPEISTNIKHLQLIRTAVKVPLAIMSWSRLEELHMSYCENFKDSPPALGSITELHLSDTGIKELGPWVKGFSRLRKLKLSGCKNLVSLPQLPDSLAVLDAENCESLEKLDGSFCNPDIFLNFVNCFKLNQDARDLIIRRSNRRVAVFPGGEVPAYFSDRATGRTLTVKLNEKPPHTSRFKTCIVLVNNLSDADLTRYSMYSSYIIKDKQNGLSVRCEPRYHHLPYLTSSLTGHLYTSELEAETDVTSDELFFEFTVGSADWAIKECGVLQLF